MSVRPTSAAAVGLLVVGLVLHIVGLSTTSWAIVKVTEPGAEAVEVEAGLWEVCNDGTCVDWPSELISDQDFHKASQAMAILGMIFCVGATLAAGAAIYFFHKDNKNQLGAVRVATPVLAALAGTFVLIAVIIMKVKIEDEIESRLEPTSTLSVELGYSSGLSIAAAILMFIGGAFGFYGARSS